MAKQLTHYQVLGVSERATVDELRSAWRKIAAVAHPDVGGSNEAFATVSAAYAVLSDASERRRYDEELAAARAARAAKKVGTASGGGRPRPNGAWATSAPPSTGARGSAERSAGSAGEATGSNTNLGAFVTVHGLVALELVALVWFSVWLRGRGIVTIFDPHDAHGHLVGGPVSVPGPFSMVTLGWWMLALVAATVLRPVLVVLDWREQVWAAGLLEIIALSAVGAVHGSHLAWTFALWAALGVLALWLRGWWRTRRRGRSLVSTASWVRSRSARR
jgi:hypothetical protein